MPLGTEVGLGPGDIVLDGDPPPPPKKKGAQQPHTFRPMSIVTKWLDASKCHLLWRKASADATLLDGDKLPRQEKGVQPLNFQPMYFWPNGWMSQDAIWYGGRPCPMPHSVRRMDCTLYQLKKNNLAVSRQLGFLT